MNAYSLFSLLGQVWCASQITLGDQPWRPPLFVFFLSLCHLAVGEVTSFNVALKEGEIIIYIDNCDIQLFPCLLHVDFISVWDRWTFFFKLIQGKCGVMFCRLKLASEKTCMLASWNEAVNFEGLQLGSWF